MRVYRIERQKHLETTLSGLGASLSEGFRWNSFNTAIVYTSESRALAMLEVSVHLDLAEDLPIDRQLVEIEIPNEVEILLLHEADLPPQWDAKPPLSATQYIGDDFVFSQAAAVLQVPSSIIPYEYNYLINPNHPDAQHIAVAATYPLSFDARWRS